LPISIKTRLREWNILAKTARIKILIIVYFPKLKVFHFSSEVLMSAKKQKLNVP